MIPALLAHTVHQALAYKPRQPAQSTATAAADASGGKLGNQGVGRSIASDLGQLTSDTLSLLGLGTAVGTGTGGTATQAYAAAGHLGGR